MQETSPTESVSADHPCGDAEVRLALEDAVRVDKFLSDRRPLSLEECRQIVEEAIRLLEGLYVHLPLKRAMYAVDPVRRLHLLEMKLGRFIELERRLSQGGSIRPGEWPLPIGDMWFHQEMSETFTSVRDLHTIYALPTPFDRAVAFLPFQIEDYYDGEEHRFTVSNVIEGLDWFDSPGEFTRGVTVTHWNGIPIQRAVELVGEHNPGNNPDARTARGLARLTIRPLAKTLPPDEEWVTLTYVARDNKPRSVKVEWRIATLPEGLDLPPDGTPFQQIMGQGVDHEMDMIRLLRREAYGPPLKGKAKPWSLRARERVVVEDIPDLDAKVVALDGKQYGYVRIRTFKISDDRKFLLEFIKLVEQLPNDGLIIDVRDNPGGCILSGERLLQVLTPRTIRPETAQFINSPLSLELCNLFPEYLRWAESLRRATQTNTMFSSNYRLSPHSLCNSVGQRYYGPSVLITNSLSYSTTDIFSAGFQDHRIGTVIGIDRSTGAGGANVVAHSALRRRFEKVKAAAAFVNNPVPVWPLGNDLPGQADFHVAIRRTSRVRSRSGMELEDLGVIPDCRYYMTIDDVMHGNRDLIAFAAGVLSKMPSYELREVQAPVFEAPDHGTLRCEVRTRGIEWLEIFVDGRACGSQNVKDGNNKLTIPWTSAATPKRLSLRGYREDGQRADLIAARNIQIRAPSNT